MWLFGLLLSSMAVSTLMQFVLAVLAPFIISEYSLSRTTYGSAASLLFLCAVAVSLLAGRLVNSWSEAAVVRTLYTAAVLAFVVMAVVPGWIGVLLAAMVMGFPLGIGNPVTNVLIATRVPPESQGTAAGVKQSGVQVGALFVGLCVPPVAAAYGWRTAAAMLAVIALCGLAVTLPLRAGVEVPAGHSGLAERPSAEHRSSALATFLSAYAVLAGVGASAVNAFLPLFAFEVLAVPADRAGLIIALLGMFGATARVLVGVLDDTWWRFEFWLAGLALAGAASLALLFPAMSHPALLWVAVIGFGASTPAWQTTAVLALVRESGAAARSSGLVFGSFLVGMVLGPLSFGWLTDVTGTYVAGWLLVIGAFVVAGALAVSVPGWNRNRNRRRSAG